MTTRPEAVRAAGGADTSSSPTRSDSSIPVRIHGAPPPPRKKRGRPPKSTQHVVEDAPKPIVPGDPAPMIRRGHALDHAPVHSKIVKVIEGCVLATPDHATYLPKEDAANALPVGAKIVKASDGHFVSTQLDPSEDHPATVHTTAIEAIAAFVSHFHPRG